MCLKAADTNDDGTVDLSDALFALNYLFLGGPRIREPFPECGLDTTPDSLTCFEHPPCYNFSRCPDPAAQTIRFEVLRKETPSSGIVEIRGTLKNRGGVYESSAGQQDVNLYEKAAGGTPRLVASNAFEDLGPSGEEYVAFKREWGAAPFGQGKFQPSYILEVTYAHGLSEDGNDRNDDCDFDNNLREVSGDTINDLFQDR